MTSDDYDEGYKDGSLYMKATILKLIDEKIKDIVSKGEQMADATHDNYFNNMAQDRRLCLEELKEELEK